MIYEKLSRHENRTKDGDTINRCPNCKEMFRDFMIVNDDMLGCMQCGTVFVKKEVRAENTAHYVMLANAPKVDPKEEPEAPEEMKEEPAICPECGFEAKSALGLGSHLRTHRKKAVNE